MVSQVKFDPKQETTVLPESTKNDKQIPVVSKDLLEYVKGYFQVAYTFTYSDLKQMDIETIAKSIIYNSGKQAVIDFLESLSNIKRN